MHRKPPPLPWTTPVNLFTDLAPIPTPYTHAWPHLHRQTPCTSLPCASPVQPPAAPQPTVLCSCPPLRHRRSTSNCCRLRPTTVGDSPADVGPSPAANRQPPPANRHPRAVLFGPLDTRLAVRCNGVQPSRDALRKPIKSFSDRYGQPLDLMRPPDPSAQSKWQPSPLPSLVPSFWSRKSGSCGLHGLLKQKSQQYSQSAQSLMLRMILPPPVNLLHSLTPTHSLPPSLPRTLACPSPPSHPLPCSLLPSSLPMSPASNIWPGPSLPQTCGCARRTHPTEE